MKGKFCQVSSVLVRRSSVFSFKNVKQNNPYHEHNFLISMIDNILLFLIDGAIGNKVCGHYDTIYSLTMVCTTNSNLNNYDLVAHWHVQPGSNPHRNQFWSIVLSLHGIMNLYIPYVVNLATGYFRILPWRYSCLPP